MARPVTAVPRGAVADLAPPPLGWPAQPGLSTSAAYCRMASPSPSLGWPNQLGLSTNPWGGCCPWIPLPLSERREDGRADRPTLRLHSGVPEAPGPPRRSLPSISSKAGQRTRAPAATWGHACSLSVGRAPPPGELAGSRRRRRRVCRLTPSPLGSRAATAVACAVPGRRSRTVDFVHRPSRLTDLTVRRPRAAIAARDADCRATFWSPIAQW